MTAFSLTSLLVQRLPIAYCARIAHIRFSYGVEIYPCSWGWFLVLLIVGVNVQVCVMLVDQVQIYVPDIK